MYSIVLVDFIIKSFVWNLMLYKANISIAMSNLVAQKNVETQNWVTSKILFALTQDFSCSK